MATQDEFIADLAKVEIRPETRQKILDLIEKEGFTLDTKALIADMIQADIDKDFAEEEVMLEANDPEVGQATKEFTDSMDAIEEELNDSLKVVDEKTNELNGMVDALDKAVTDKRIADIKAEI